MKTHTDLTTRRVPHWVMLSFSVILTPAIAAALNGCRDPAQPQGSMFDSIDYSPGEVDRLFGLGVSTAKPSDFRSLVGVAAMRKPFCICSFETTRELADDLIRNQIDRLKADKFEHSEFVEGNEITLWGFYSNGHIKHGAVTRHTLAANERAFEWRSERYQLNILAREVADTTLCLISVLRI